MNNVLVAQICRKHGFDAKTQIIGEGEVAEQLRTHVNQKDFGLNEVNGDWTEILALASIEDLMQREKAQDAIRFTWLQMRFASHGYKTARSSISSRPRWSLPTISKP